jgi:hypothetical protein
MAETGRHGGLAHGSQRLFQGLGLEPFRALGDLELDPVTFVQGLETRGFGNRRVVDEDVRTLILRDKPKPFWSLNHLTVPLAIE